MSIPLSVLDLSPVAAGHPPSQAIRDSITLARRAEELGYVRTWFAEHHALPSIAASAPEILIAHAAAVTSRMKLGAGGIMLPNHVPLHVLEVFRTLEALHPGRIDLGLGRAPGTDPVTASALRRSDRVDPNELLAELLAFDEGDFPEGHPFAAIHPQPSDVALPTVWMLGSTDEGARIGAAIGVGYAFAGHFSMKWAKTAMRLYRQRFQPSPRRATPHAILCVSVVCAETHERARQLAAPARLAVVRMRTGRPAALASIEEALAYSFSAQEDAIADEFFTGAAIGTPEAVRVQLESLVEATGADELMISTMVAGLEDRLRSYELVAGLEVRGAGPPHAAATAATA